MIYAVLITISLCFLVYRFRLDVLNNETLGSRKAERNRIFEEVRDMPGVLTIAVDEIYLDKDNLYIKSDPVRETFYFNSQDKDYYGKAINEVFDMKLSIDKRFVPCKIGLYGSVYRTVSNIFFRREELYLPIKIFTDSWTRVARHVATCLPLTYCWGISFLCG